MSLSWSASALVSARAGGMRAAAMVFVVAASEAEALVLAVLKSLLELPHEQAQAASSTIVVAVSMRVIADL